MNNTHQHAMRRAMTGTVWVFLAEALILPTGLVSSIFLTNKLGVTGYGAFTLAATIIAWVEWTIASVFARPAIKFVGEAADWRPVGSAVARQYLLLGVLSAIAICALAWPLGRLLNEPSLPKYLCLFAIDIPVFGLAQAHRNILIGLGEFPQRALASAARWIARLILIIVLLEMGWSVEGAIVASILASFVELAVGRIFVRPSLRASGEVVGSLWGYATTLLLSVLSLRLYEKLDLMMLKALGAATATAGVYGAAQNLSVLPGIFAMSFTPLVLATISRTSREHGVAAARDVATQSLRLTVMLLPLAAIAAGCAHEIVRFIYAPDYAAAGGPLSALILGAWGMLGVSTGSAVLIGYDRPGLVLGLTAPLIPVTFMGLYVVIPRYGPTGAACVTAAVGLACAVAFIVACRRVSGACPAAWTLVRTVLVSLAMYTLSSRWATPGFAVTLKIMVLSIGTAAAFVITGEVSRRDLSFLLASLPGRSPKPAAAVS